VWYCSTTMGFLFNMMRLFLFLLSVHLGISGNIKALLALFYIQTKPWKHRWYATHLALGIHVRNIVPTLSDTFFLKVPLLGPYHSKSTRNYNSSRMVSSTSVGRPRRTTAFLAFKSMTILNNVALPVSFVSNLHIELG
jgi:hypothetical protein